MSWRRTEAEVWASRVDGEGARGEDEETVDRGIGDRRLNLIPQPLCL